MRLLNSHNQAHDDTGLGIRAEGEIYLKHSLVITNMEKTYREDEIYMVDEFCIEHRLRQRIENLKIKGCSK